MWQNIFSFEHNLQNISMKLLENEKWRLRGIPVFLTNHSFLSSPAGVHECEFVSNLNQEFKKAHGLFRIISAVTYLDILLVVRLLTSPCIDCCF